MSTPGRHEQLLRSAVIVLLAVHAALLVWSASRHSPVYDEPAHLAVGVRDWQLGKFDLYKVNPPTIRMWATLPVMLTRPNTNWGDYPQGPGARGEFQADTDFLYANPDRWMWHFTLARWAMIPWMVLGGYVCSRWAEELYGPWSGLFAAALWCFSPSILGLGAFLTLDAAAAATGVLAGYCFWRWLHRPNWPRTAAAGFALGLAQLTKMTWAILWGLWPLLWFAWALRRSHPVNPPRRTKGLGQLTLVLLLGLFFVNLAYGFRGTIRQLEDYQFVSRTLACKGARCGDVGNRFAGTLLGKMPVPLPESYLAGIDLQKKDFELHRWSYLNGEWQRGGWWYYYLEAFLLKEPLGLWVLFLMAAGLTVWKSQQYSAGWREELVLLGPAVAVFGLVSSQTAFNWYLRYAVPAFPFVFIWTSRTAKGIDLKQWPIAVLAAAALLWSAGSSLSVYPHSLSYFNELAGGPTGGHRYLIEGNIDWGQDLWYLKEWHEEHPEARPLYADVYSSVSLLCFGIDAWPPPEGPGADVDPRKVSSLEARRWGPRPGWYAMSVHRLHDREGRYGYFLRHFEPVAMVGYSIYIYHITEAEANRVRRELGLPELPKLKKSSEARPVRP